MKVTIFTITALLMAPRPAFSQVSVPTIQTTPPTIQTTPAAPKDAGLEFEGFGTPNTARITDTIYRGECPGESQGSINARFYSTGKSPTPQITLTQVGRDRDVYETVIMQGNIVRVTGGSDI